MPFEPEYLDRDCISGAHAYCPRSTRNCKNCPYDIDTDDFTEYIFTQSRAADIVDHLGEDWYSAPASTRHHGAYPGGLSEHTSNVLENLRNLTKSLGLRWEHDDSPFVVALGHDLCKLGAYIEVDGQYTWNHKHRVGHGSLSVKILEEWGIDLTEMERYCIQYHMGPWTRPEDEIGGLDYTAAIRKHPNILYTHMADMMATYIDEVV